MLKLRHGLRMVLLDLQLELKIPIGTSIVKVVCNQNKGTLKFKNILQSIVKILNIYLVKRLFINLRDAVKLSVSLMNCPLTIANFGIASTKNAFLINAILANVTAYM